jgi:hypothetical protein
MVDASALVKRHHARAVVDPLTFAFPVVRRRLQRLFRFSALRPGKVPTGYVSGRPVRVGIFHVVLDSHSSIRISLGMTSASSRVATASGRSSKTAALEVGCDTRPAPERSRLGSARDIACRPTATASQRHRTMKPDGLEIIPLTKLHYKRVPLQYSRQAGFE